MADKEAPKDEGLPLGQIALDMVRRAESGPEKYIIHPKGPEVICAAVQVVLLSGEAPAGMARRFREVIALCYVLDEKVGSKAAAEVLAKALFSEPRVAQILGSPEREANQKRRVYRKFLDEGDLARAPNIQDRSPEDALKLSSFLSPGQQDMMGRARKTAAKRESMAAKANVRRTRLVPEAEPAEEKTPKKPSGRRLPPGARKV